MHADHRYDKRKVSYLLLLVRWCRSGNSRLTTSAIPSWGVTSDNRGMPDAGRSARRPSSARRIARRSASRPQVVDRTDKDTLQIFVQDHVADDDVQIYTDDTSAYKGLPNPHETVKHSAAEYVRYLEARWSTRTAWRASGRCSSGRTRGVYHKMSAKHLQQYVDTFAGRQNVREMDTLAQMQHVVAGLVGRRLMYRDLVAPNGRSSMAV